MDKYFPSLRTFLLLTMIFQVFNGISAIFGGMGLMCDPSGKALG